MSTHGLEHEFWSVIPAGGSGTRLWPLSRAARPKFLLPLLGEESLIQLTVNRLMPLTPPERNMVICGPAHAVPVARQLPGMPAENILVEPLPRGSGPAIGLAAAIIAARNPNAIMGSFAADHDVRDTAAFEAAVRTAIETAKQDWLVTIGLTPTRPETGYGYIERTDDVVAQTANGTAYRSARFVEKPDMERAIEFVQSGHFLWNASMFIWRVGYFMETLQRFQPELAEGLVTIAKSWGTPLQDEVMAQVWSNLPDVTIDNGVMELAERVAVVPSEMGWSDVGDWHGLGMLIQADSTGNAMRGDHIAPGTSNSVVWSDTGRMIAVIGLDDVVVVDTHDALLVAHRSRAQDVRKAVDLLKQMERRELL